MNLLYLLLLTNRAYSYDPTGDVYQSVVEIQAKSIETILDAMLAMSQFAWLLSH